jgi:hypothetical protein
LNADSEFATPALADLYRNGQNEIVEGGHRFRGWLLAGRVRRRGLHLWRRPVLRLDRWHTPRPTCGGGVGLLTGRCRCLDRQDRRRGLRQAPPCTRF